MKKCLCNFYSSISKTIIILSLLQTAVAICPPGHDWNSLTGECVGCRDKYFKIDTGDNACRPCSQGQNIWYAVTSTQPRNDLQNCKCRDGFQTAYNLTTKNLECTLQTCASGMARNEYDFECHSCPLDSVKPFSGESGCVKCPRH